MRADQFKRSIEFNRSSTSNFFNSKEALNSQVKEQKSKIESLYNKEFEEGVYSILTETNYMISFKSRIKIVLEESLQNFDEKEFKDFLQNLDEKITERYKILKNLLQKALNDSVRASVRTSELMNKFRKHCKNCPDEPIHSCQGKLIMVKENEKKFIVCKGCQVVFEENSLELYCTCCSTVYYSSLVNNSEETYLQPATWENYHCGAIFNSQMRCIKCKDYLFVKINEENTVYCKSCKFRSNPEQIIWICNFCKNEFSSKVKFYNQLEFRVIKNGIREALLKKMVAKPKSIPCCGKNILINYVFKHKTSCQGELYFATLNSIQMLVCSRCKSLINYESYFWTCPGCNSKFLDENKDNSEKKSNSQSSTLETAKNNSNLILTPKEKVFRNDESNQTGKNKLDRDFEDLKKRNRSVYKYSNSNLKNINSLNDGIQIEIKKSNEKNDESVDENNESFDREDFLKNREKQTCGKNINLNKPFAFPNKKDEKPTTQFNFVRDQKIRDERQNQKILFGQENPNNNTKFINGNSNVNITPFSQTNSNSGFRIGNRSPIAQIDTPKNGVKVEIPVKLNSNINNSGNKNVTNNSQFVQNQNIYGFKDRPSNKAKSNNLVLSSSMNNSNDYSTPTKQPIRTNSQLLEIFDIDELKIIQTIGEGSFGVIYSAEKIKTKEKFAMKKIIVNNDDEMSLFVKEFELVSKLRHNNILPIYAICKKQLDFSTKVLYILMELANSDWDKEIKNRFKTSSFYKEQELIFLLKQIISSLAFLQSKGISHRDIKPQNILVFPKNVYKIADFGEAKIIKNDKKRMETLRGTELYMSPILFNALRVGEKNNVEHNTYKSDIYSLGYCLLYATTLSYKILYELRNQNNQKVVTSIIRTHLGKRYSKEFIDIILRMVDISESARFDFLELDAFLNQNF